MSRKPKSSKFFLYGVHAVNAALENSKRSHKQLLVTEELAKQYQKYLTILKVTPRKELDALFPSHTVHQGVVLETTPLPSLHLEDVESTADLILAFDQVTDPHNVGAILRSAACFNVDAVLHTHRNAPNEAAVMAKVACGALEQVPFVNVVNLARSLDALKEKGFWVVGLSEHGEKSLAKISLPNKAVLVIGAEGAGMRRLIAEKCDFLVQLPTNPNFPTLNASNAAAVALYEIQRQRGDR